MPLIVRMLRQCTGRCTAGCEHSKMLSSAVLVGALLGCVRLAAGQPALFSLRQTSVTVNEFAAGATVRLQRPLNESSAALDVSFSTSDGSARAIGTSRYHPCSAPSPLSCTHTFCARYCTPPTMLDNTVPALLWWWWWNSVLNLNSATYLLICSIGHHHCNFEQQRAPRADDNRCPSPASRKRRRGSDKL
jgi:hypothetical protein